MAQQTAVEWLVDNIPQVDWSDPYYKLILEEAKKTEEKQKLEYALIYHTSIINNLKKLFADNNETYTK
jgi:hypothetical protein